jgi:ElaB/YqjD/DUF883 family membrane-anchored ribosome-binding protein
MIFNGRGSSVATNDIKRDLQSLRDDVSKLAEQITGDLSEGGTEVLNQARERIDHLRQTVNDVMVTKGREAGAVANDLASSVEETLHSRPLTTLAVAMGIGFVFGTTWRNRG